ncbi:protein E33A [Proboscivirus elephantidbeta4]|uniref:Protein E33A n=1 Tax=Elephant endotheliotropic herpesvirus 4 TaxID=548914 RepID=A0A0S1TQ75_9BETA|nr:protein E33A [Elephant endotheliotropic herpesvirus 4]ALM25968.1 protein E33A [Elephant endotheliotropic herpesvirus 4]
MKIFALSYIPLPGVSTFKELSLSLKIWLLVMFGYLMSLFLTDLVWGLYCALVFDLLGSNPNFKLDRSIAPKPGNCIPKIVP